jgi:hypothetical protein
MNVEQLVGKLGYELLQPRGGEQEVTDAYTSDLMSDVMANAPAGSMLITIQAHKNTIAVAGLVGAVGVIICNDRPVPDELMEVAAAENICIARTNENQFEVSHRVHQLVRGDAL